MTAVLGEDGVQDTHLPTAKVSYYLSEIAKDASAKGSQVWQHFFAPGPNDLQSHRVERRVRQMRSDPAIRDSTMFIDRKDSLNSDADSIAAMVALSQQFIETSEDPEIPKASDIVKRQVSPEKAPEEKTLPLLPASNQTRVQDVFHGGNVSAPMHEEPVPISNEELDGEAAPLSPAEMSQEEITPADATMTAAALVQGRRVQKRVERKTTLSDFDILRVLGKGCAGKVMLVRHHSSTKLYAMKSIHKREYYSRHA